MQPLFRVEIFFIIFFGVTVWAGCDSPTKTGTDTKQSAIDIFDYNQELGRGINLGNALEAPHEGQWGVTIEDHYFKTIKKAGFDNVRIPIRWSAHTAVDSPYTINYAFRNRVDWVIAQALSNDLKVVINIHHFEDIMTNPAQEKEKLLCLWRQLGRHYQDFTMDLSFEILNEPNDQLTPKLWNQYLADALNVIRETNPERPVLVGTAEWGGLAALKDLELPADDNIILTFHYYEPFQFTHQGAEWVDGSAAWLGTNWRDKESEIHDIASAFDYAADWAETNNVPVYVGEFGVYSAADSKSRQLWTARVRKEAEERDFSWAYWEFCAGFGAYDNETETWRSYLLEALIAKE